jgi:ATPase subunit of ABC transporter with duplicated ATPase domains
LFDVPAEAMHTDHDCPSNVCKQYGRRCSSRRRTAPKDFPHDSIGVLRSLADAFQFSGDEIDKKIRSLSGEKTRPVIARMLASFEGTMLFVSHDRAFLRGLSNRILALGGDAHGTPRPQVYPGSYVDYVARSGHEAPGVHG